MKVSALVKMRVFTPEELSKRGHEVNIDGPYGYELVTVRKDPSSINLMMFFRKKHNFAASKFCELMGMFGLGFGFGVAFWFVFS